MNARGVRVKNFIRCDRITLHFAFSFTIFLKNFFVVNFEILVPGNGGTRYNTGRVRARIDTERAEEFSQKSLAVSRQMFSVTTFPVPGNKSTSTESK